MTTPKAPKALGTSGRSLWRRVLSEYELAAPELTLLEGACLAYDRLTGAQEVLDRDGLMLDGRYGPRAHPMAAIARDSTTLLARCLRQLDVALDADLPRPTRTGAKPGPKPRRAA